MDVSITEDNEEENGINEKEKTKSPTELLISALVYGGMSELIDYLRFYHDYWF